MCVWTGVHKAALESRNTHETNDDLFFFPFLFFQIPFFPLQLYLSFSLLKASVDGSLTLLARSPPVSSAISLACCSAAPLHPPPSAPLLLGNAQFRAKPMQTANSRPPLHPLALLRGCQSCTLTYDPQMLFHVSNSDPLYQFPIRQLFLFLQWPMPSLNFYIIHAPDTTRSKPCWLMISLTIRPY